MHFHVKLFDIRPPGVGLGGNAAQAMASRSQHATGADATMEHQQRNQKDLAHPPSEQLPMYDGYRSRER